MINTLGPNSDTDFIELDRYAFLKNNIKYILINDLFLRYSTSSSHMVNLHH